MPDEMMPYTRRVSREAPVRPWAFPRNRPAILILLAATLACTGETSSMSSLAPLGEYVTPDAEYSPVQYWDRGEISLNEYCPVTGSPLSTEIEPLYVNGRPIGFC